jgi:hypothetical protein
MQAAKKLDKKSGFKTAERTTIAVSFADSGVQRRSDEHPADYTTLPILVRFALGGPCL